MVDDRHFSGNNPPSQATSGEGFGAAPAGYCQECGRPLTISTVRRVANGVFCVPCSSYRQTTPAWNTVSGGLYGTGTIPGPRPSGAPNPVFAAVLGFIPGVGAMYNGQYAKGAMHLVVFVVLLTLASNLNDAFNWFVVGWIFYQAFDAYHTARARRDGLPLPNPFGWNDIGERFGFHRGAPVPPPTAGGFGAGTGFSGDASAPQSEAASRAEYTGANTASRPAQAPFERYAEPARPFPENPYTAPFTAPPTPPPYSGVTSVPYAPTYTGAPAADPAVVIQPVVPTRRSFPVGAIWLIVLGVIFLSGNILPSWRISGRWLVPVMLMGAAAWSGVRRWQHFRVASLTIGASPNFAGAMTGPVVLFTVASLLTLQAADVIGMHRSWPVLLVVWGSMQLLQRASSTPVIPFPVNPPEPIAPPQARSTSGTGTFGL